MTIATPSLTRELTVPEFSFVKEVCYHYHQQEANPEEDRIFSTFVDGTNDRRCAVPAASRRARS